MTKTQVIRSMAEQMEVPPKQVASFFNLVIFPFGPVAYAVSFGIETPTGIRPLA